jgi:hypothetical protein
MTYNHRSTMRPSAILKTLLATGLFFAASTERTSASPILNMTKLHDTHDTHNVHDNKSLSLINNNAQYHASFDFNQKAIVGANSLLDLNNDILFNRIQSIIERLDFSSLDALKTSIKQTVEGSTCTENIALQKVKNLNICTFGGEKQQEKYNKEASALMKKLLDSKELTCPANFPKDKTEIDQIYEEAIKLISTTTGKKPAQIYQMIDAAMTANCKEYRDSKNIIINKLNTKALIIVGGCMIPGVIFFAIAALCYCTGKCKD